jgi:hypothetical protein
MALEPFLSLTPTNPYDSTYDPGNPDVPYAYGQLRTFGGRTAYSGWFPLETQYSNDMIIVGGNAVALSDQTISSLNDLYQRCTIWIEFQGRNVSTKNQYLLLFALQHIVFDARAQFFVGTELVWVEEIHSDEQVAILMDVPGENMWVDVYIRLASPSFWATMGFKGMDCYLL